jgi:hypothetical protein
MIRTQISLDKLEYALAKKEARTLGISVAELVRRALRHSLSAQGDASHRNASKPDTPWMRYIGLVESGDPNSSRNIDEIVYGFKD